MPQLPLQIREKVTRLYLHASVSGYTCMQAYPGATQSGVSGYYFKYGIGSFAGTIFFWAENGEKGVKNMFFEHVSATRP